MFKSSKKSGNCDEREVGANLREKRRKNVNRGSVRIFNEPSDLNFFVEFFLKPLVPPGKRSNFQRSLLKIAFKKTFKNLVVELVFQTGYNKMSFERF